MVEFRKVANFDAVWLPRWRRGEVRAYMAKKKVCSDYLFENSCNCISFKTSVLCDCFCLFKGLLSAAAPEEILVDLTSKATGSTPC